MTWTTVTTVDDGEIVDGRCAYRQNTTLTRAVIYRRSVLISFFPRSGTPLIIAHSIADWVGLKVGLDTVDKRKISCSCWESNPGRLAYSSSLYRPSYPGYQIYQ
jgi:hypothetical protein